MTVDWMGLFFLAIDYNRNVVKPWFFDLLWSRRLGFQWLWIFFFKSWHIVLWKWMVCSFSSQCIDFCSYSFLFFPPFIWGGRTTLFPTFLETRILWPVSSVLDVVLFLVYSIEFLTWDLTCKAASPSCWTNPLDFNFFFSAVDAGLFFLGSLFFGSNKFFYEFPMVQNSCVDWRALVQMAILFLIIA